MAKQGEEMNARRKNVKSKAELFRLAGIGPELAEFVTELIKTPEHFYSIPFERRRELENQMDAILSSFKQ